MHILFDPATPPSGTETTDMVANVQVIYTRTIIALSFVTAKQ